MSLSFFFSIEISVTWLISVEEGYTEMVNILCALFQDLWNK